MKYFTILLFACCAVGLTCASNLPPSSSDDVQRVLLGVQNLEKLTLQKYFKSIGVVLKTIFQNLFGIITALIPGDTPLKLNKLIPELKALKVQQVQPIIKKTLEQLKIQKILFTETLVPREILKVNINVDDLIKSIGTGKSFITLANFLNIIGEKVAKYYTPVL